ncbi:MAG: guanine permease [Verrucomicrobia bacterium]|nr:MAG: guanine permease [Verrucomicrobiota bacterium]
MGTKRLSNFLEAADKYFEIGRRGSTFGTEAVGALTTFAAMSYILMVNPAILSSTGMDRGALVTVTALASLFGCAMMGLFAKMPIAQAPAMGTNTYFAVIICAGMGLTWEQALALTFYNGLVFLAISVSGVREKIIRAVPQCLQVGLQCGIGMFIAFFGLQHSGIVISNANTLVGIGDFDSPESMLTLVGFALMAVFVSRNFRGAIICVILALTAVSFFVTGSDGAPLAKLPESIVSVPHGISETFLKLDWSYPFENARTAIPAIFTLLILDLFDTIGTVVALGRQSGLMGSDMRMPNMGKTLISDSCATIAGALLGTSTTGSYVESSAGIEAGARTGLSAVLVGVLFALALFFTPIISAVPSFATAPALIMVGIMMMKGLKYLDASDMTQLLPAVFCMMMVAFSFSITYGFAFGMLSYVLLETFNGRGRRISPTAWIIFASMTAFVAIKI